MMKAGPFRDDDAAAGRGAYTVGELKDAVRLARLAMETRSVAVFGEGAATDDASLRCVSFISFVCSTSFLLFAHLFFCLLIFFCLPR